MGPVAGTVYEVRLPNPARVIATFVDGALWWEDSAPGSLYVLLSTEEFDRGWIVVRRALELSTGREVLIELDCHVETGARIFELFARFPRRR